MAEYCRHSWLPLREALSKTSDCKVIVCPAASQTDPVTYRSQNRTMISNDGHNPVSPTVSSAPFRGSLLMVDLYALILVRYPPTSSSLYR